MLALLRQLGTAMPPWSATICKSLVVQTIFLVEMDRPSFQPLRAAPKSAMPILALPIVPSSSLERGSKPILRIVPIRFAGYATLEVLLVRRLGHILLLTQSWYVLKLQIPFLLLQHQPLLLLVLVPAMIHISRPGREASTVSIVVAEWHQFDKVSFISNTHLYRLELY